LRSSAAAWRVRPQPQCWDAPGIATVLIDPHELYPFDFRVEKLSGDAQLERFFRTGIADSVLRSATHDRENWIARFGYLLDKRASRQFGISYENLISAIRAEIPNHGRRQDRIVLRRSGQAGLRRLVVGAVVRFPQGYDGQGPLLAGPALGPFPCPFPCPFPWMVSQGTLRRARNRFSAASKLRPRPAASSMSPSA